MIILIHSLHFVINVFLLIFILSYLIYNDMKASCLVGNSLSITYYFSDLKNEIDEQMRVVKDYAHHCEDIGQKIPLLCSHCKPLLSATMNVKAKKLTCSSNIDEVRIAKMKLSSSGSTKPASNLSPSDVILAPETQAVINVIDKTPDEYTIIPETADLSETDIFEYSKEEIIEPSGQVTEKCNYDNNVVSSAPSEKSKHAKDKVALSPIIGKTSGRNSPLAPNVLKNLRFASNEHDSDISKELRNRGLDLSDTIKECESPGSVHQICPTQMKVNNHSVISMGVRIDVKPSIRNTVPQNRTQYLDPASINDSPYSPNLLNPKANVQYSRSSTDTSHSNKSNEMLELPVESSKKDYAKKNPQHCSLSDTKENRQSSNSTKNWIKNPSPPHLSSKMSSSSMKASSSRTAVVDAYQCTRLQNLCDKSNPSKSNDSFLPNNEKSIIAEASERAANNRRHYKMTIEPPTPHRVRYKQTKLTEKFPKRYTSCDNESKNDKSRSPLNKFNSKSSSDDNSGLARALNPLPSNKSTLTERKLFNDSSSSTTDSARRKFDLCDTPSKNVKKRKRMHEQQQKMCSNLDDR